MSHKIKLERCHPLNEQSAVAATAAAPELPPMPADFPAELLEPEQLEAVQAWWADWQQDMLHQLRHLLTVQHPEGARESSPHTLRHLQQRCVVLCHLLGLHPAAERSMTTLAAELGVALPTLSALRGLLLRTMAQLRRPQAAQQQPPTISTLAANYPLLDWERREGKRPVIVVPFRRRLTYCSQFELCAAIAAHPGISATLTLTAAQEDALRITFHRGVHRPRTK